MNFKSVQQTDKGRVRKFNEDFMGIADVPGGKIFVLCDGMGGHLGGAMAAQIGVNTIQEYFSTPHDDIYSALAKSIATANTAVIEKAKANPRELNNMGATCVVVLLQDNQVYYAHAGDSRLYYFSKGALQLMTKDHSYVQELVDMRFIKAEEAAYHPRRNEITSALGFSDIKIKVAPDPIEPGSGDIVLLCSDGLNNMLEDEEIAQILGEVSDLSQKAKKLIDQANLKGGVDNITVQLIEII